LDKFNVALDGPAGAGKSTAARMVANALGFVYVDTGAMYRAVTWKVLQLGLHPEHTDRIIAAIEDVQIELKPGEQVQHVLINGEDVTDLIRLGEINRSVSFIAQIPQIREKLVKLQKRMADSKGIVMDGRDIGTHVIPDAEVKVFLTASVHERALRRYLEIQPAEISLEELERDIANRDKMDSERENSPLIRAKDAVLIDSTRMSLQEVVDAVLAICRSVKNGGT
jgi:cytidylate kinase